MRSGSTASRLSTVSVSEPIKPQPSLDSAPKIFNFQCISRFFVTFQCESVIVILLSYQSSCSVFQTHLAAIIYCWFVNHSILHQVKRPEQSIAGHFGCAHPGPCGGRPHGLYLLSVNSLGPNFQIVEFILLDVQQGLQPDLYSWSTLNTHLR